MSPLEWVASSVAIYVWGGLVTFGIYSTRGTSMAAFITAPFVWPWLAARALVRGFHEGLTELRAR